MLKVKAKPPVKKTTLIFTCFNVSVFEKLALNQSISLHAHLLVSIKISSEASADLTSLKNAHQWEGF